VGATLPKNLTVKLWGMTIEWLKYKVPRDESKIFLNTDANIWTAMLSRQPGFISKQTWLNPEQPEEVNLVICWQSKKHWKAISKTLLQETDKKFVETVGCFELLEVLEYTIV
jgi:uncharacterized protein (TIGR03792 family)